MSYGFQARNDGYLYTKNGEALFCLKMVKFLKDVKAAGIVTCSSEINYRTSRFGKDFYEAIAVIGDPHCLTYSKYIKENKNNLKKIEGWTEEIFKKQIVTGKSTGDFGLYDEFTYAYIIAHTDIAKHHQLRFVNWDDKKCSLIERFTDIGTLYKSLGLNKIKGGAEYVVMPISSGEHISTLIFDMTKDSDKEGFMLSFDTMGTGGGSHKSNGVFNGFNVTSLNKISIQGYSGCAYLTAYFCESILKYKSIAKIKQNIEEIKKEIVDKFEKSKQIKQSTEQQPAKQQKQSKSGKRKGPESTNWLKPLRDITDCNNTEEVTIPGPKVPNLTSEKSKSLEP